MTSSRSELVIVSSKANLCAAKVKRATRAAGDKTPLHSRSELVIGSAISLFVIQDRFFPHPQSLSRREREANSPSPSGRRVGMREKILNGSSVMYFGVLNNQ